MKVLRMIFGVLAAGLALIGCGSSGSKIEIDAGRFVAENKNQTGPGDDDAIKRLSEEIRKNPDAGEFVVQWENAYPSGNSYKREIEYKRSEKTLGFVNSKYLNVTDEVIHVTAANKGTPDDLSKHGARSG